jgi:hypothetical protein
MSGAMRTLFKTEVVSMRTAVVALALGALPCLGIGCAPEPEPVDRVQTNLVDKAVFEGEWWYSNTSIDVDYDQAAILGSNGALAPFEGSMSSDFGVDFNRGGPYVIGSPTYSFPIARIRWVIDEHFLFAFRSYELVQGGDKDAGSPDYRGEPLAVFAIEDHADVRQQYSSITGEETNVREENTADRRWYDRRFIRVNWSQNLIRDFAANDVEANDLFTLFTRASVPFYIQPGSGYAADYEPKFVRVKDDPSYRFSKEWPAEDEDKVHYMSFVTKETWSPGVNCALQGGGTCSVASVTSRNAFLRVPPKHDYAVGSLTEREFEHFGIFRSHQPSYTAGGEDRSVLHEFCASDSECGTGGSCDLEKHVCVGGLTADRGETDFLSFYVSRQNLFSDSLDETAPCVANWECDGRNQACDASDQSCAAGLAAKQGSVCDPAAHVCTIPTAAREVRRVEYRLSKHFPPYLVRQSFESVAQWNEALMRGHRATYGALPIDQSACPQGTCTARRSDVTPMQCQTDNPADYCYCGSAEDQNGQCFRAYDPFETPEAAKARGVPNPYQCHIEGPADVSHPQDYADYDPKSVYSYRFVGNECMLTLVANSCDVDPTAPCEELGDLRHQFLVHLQHGAVPFGGVAQPLSDPTTGELVVSNATIAAESIESVGTTASQLFPVLRGEVPEDEYFSGENLRGYFARLGKVEHPVAVDTAGPDEYNRTQQGRPSGAGAALIEQLSQRVTKAKPMLEKLRGQDGRVAIFSDRRAALRNTSLGGRIDAAVQADLAPTSLSNDPALLPAVPGASQTGVQSSSAALPSIATNTPIDQELKERQRRAAMAARNMDPVDSKLYNSQYWDYWAKAFTNYPNAEASLRMQQLYYKGVAVHELGHALGLRHNFAGSLDRDNYHDAYFNIARQLPLPAYEEYDTAAKGGNEDNDITGAEAQNWARDLRQVRANRLARGAGNVMTSSIMDYEGDRSNFAGIGRYDAAAVMFGYFDKVEAFDTPDATVDPAASAPAASLRGLHWSDEYRRELWTYYRGGEACVSNADCPHRAGSATTMFQPIKQTCVANPRTPPRDNTCANGGCICSNFFDDFQPGATQFSPVNYLYCHDNRAEDLSWCTTNDAGESFQETIEHYRTGWLQRYPQVYFRNFRRSGPARGSATSNIIDAVKIYQHLFFRAFYEPGFQQKPGPLGWGDQLLASADVLNWLGEIVATPDVGSYALDEQTGTYTPIDGSEAAPPGAISLEPGQGFYLWSAYQQGQNGFFRLERAGTFLDKLAAIEAVSRREWGLSYTYDERFFINFYDVFAPEVMDLFGGLLLRNPKAYAPRVAVDSAGQPTLSYLNLFRGPGQSGLSNEETYPAPAVDGTDSDVLRDAAAIFALSEFPVFYDTSFEQRLLVFKLGSGDGYKIPRTRADGTNTCAFGDADCDQPDFIVYESDRLHTSFVAVVIQPDGEDAHPEQQLGFLLLRRLREQQEQIRTLSAQDNLNASDAAQLTRLRTSLERDESFVDYLIELSREFGISSSLFR